MISYVSIPCSIFSHRRRLNSSFCQHFGLGYSRGLHLLLGLSLGALRIIGVSVLDDRRCLLLLLLASEQAATEDRVLDSNHLPAIVVKETQKVLVYAQILHRFTKRFRHVLTDFFGNPRWNLIKNLSVWLTSLLITHRITLFNSNSEVKNKSRKGTGKNKTHICEKPICAQADARVYNQINRQSK